MGGGGRGPLALPGPVPAGAVYPVLMTDDGMTATGGLHGITEDTPERAGAPTGAGSIDGISAAGDPPATAEESRTTGGTQITLENSEAAPPAAQDADQTRPALSREEQEEQREKGLGDSEDGGVTGEHNF